jgi:hypothetical protein
MSVLPPIQFAAGLLLVGFTLRSAVRTFVLPRSARDPLTREVFRTLGALFRAPLRLARSYEGRDRLMALYAPTGLLGLVAVYLTLVLAGYMGMFHALGAHTWEGAFALSGSSLLTLGFTAPRGLAQLALSFTEAGIGLTLAALLVAYLPAIYGAFARREASVAMLETRAGSPPSGVDLLVNYQRLGRFDRLDELWGDWEKWFITIEESHSSLAALAFFRSTQPERSWITAAGAVLDAISLRLAAVDAPDPSQAELTHHAGAITLRRVATIFDVPPAPDAPPESRVSVTRLEFDAAYDRLAGAGLPMLADRDAAWRSFARARGAYDVELLGLATLTMAPYAPWSSDRSLRMRASDLRRAHEEPREPMVG